MAGDFPFTEKDRIEVGKPLPFSIFSADGKLLLAAGRIVESERLREALIRHGRYRGSAGVSDMGSAAGGGLGRSKRDAREPAAEEPPPGPPPTPLERMRKEFETSDPSQRPIITMARAEGERSHTVQLLGAHAQVLIVTAPVNPDGSLLPVQPGQTWTCRTFQMLSAFRFMAVAVKAAFEPFPHLFLKVQKDVEQQRLRKAPRVRLLLDGALTAQDTMPCLVVDLSATGARLAVDYPLALERGTGVKLKVSIPDLAPRSDFSLEAVIVNTFGASDKRYPEVSFYGIAFRQPAEPDLLSLHAFVNGELVSKTNSLWQMLTVASSPPSPAPKSS